MGLSKDAHQNSEVFQQFELFSKFVLTALIVC